MDNFHKLTVSKIIFCCLFSLWFNISTAHTNNFVKDEAFLWESEGSINDPHLIYDYDDLKKVKDDLSAVYRLMADIDASPSRFENAGQGFEPIGVFDEDFSGIFNGGGHVIRNLYIYRPETNCIGLFGKTHNCTIDSVGMVNVDITGDFQVGALIGLNEGSATHCWSSGKIKAFRDAGGLVGTNYTYPLTYCYSSCSISGDMEIGGLVGFNMATISKCYATGNVSANSTAGGVAGINWNYIDNCYATGSVSSYVGNGGYYGGVVGKNEYQTVSYCYGAGKVVASDNSGGVDGCTVYQEKISRCYYDKNTTGMANSNEGLGLSTTQMRDEGIFWFWDFDSVWNILQNETYPALNDINNAPFAYPDVLKTSNRMVGFNEMLANDCDFETRRENLVLAIEELNDCEVNGNTIMLPSYASNGDVFSVTYRVGEVLSSGDTLWGNRALVNINCSMKGSGTEPDPFLIYTYDDLKAINNNLKAVYRLMNDIDASASKSENRGKGFDPIGSSNYSALTSQMFMGALHGGGHAISNLYINQPDSDMVGLFGYGNYCLIDSLELRNVDITANSYTGALVGMLYSGTINNCNVTGSVTGKTIITGGLIGSNSGNITRCFSNCILKSFQCVGGLVGYNTGNISNSHSSGDVSCTNGTAGGFVGQSYHQAVISNCSSNAKITSSGSGGGFIGSNNAKIILCHSSGKVICDNTAGGFVGVNSDTISRCYSSGTVTKRTMVAGFAGNNDGNISNCYATGYCSGLMYVAGFCANNRGSVSNCYASGRVVGSYSALGFTKESSDSFVSGCYYNTTTTEQNDTLSGIPLATEQMITKESFNGWDFTSIWDISEGKTYPVLRGMDNAPFAFADSVKLNQTGIVTRKILRNDYDFETGGKNLVYWLGSNYGMGIIDEYGFYLFPIESPVGTRDSLLYRVGEVVSVGDTLWGNYAWLKIINTDEIIKIEPFINWSNPQAIVYGQPLGENELNATAETSGQLVYSPGAGTILEAGEGQMLSVIFIPDDTVWWKTTCATAIIDVDKAQLIAMINDTTIEKGDAIPLFDIIFQGFVNGDNVTDIDQLPQATTMADNNSEKGKYPIIVSGGFDDNYSFEYVNGTLTVIENVSSELPGDITAVAIFPNPFTDCFTIVTPDSKSGFYSLIDIAGHTVIAGRIVGNKTIIESSQLNRGCFIVVVTIDSRTTRSQIVKL